MAILMLVRRMLLYFIKEFREFLFVFACAYVRQHKASKINEHHQCWSSLLLISFQLSHFFINYFERKRTKNVAMKGKKN